VVLGEGCSGEKKDRATKEGEDPIGKNDALKKWENRRIPCSFCKC